VEKFVAFGCSHRLKIDYKNKLHRGVGTPRTLYFTKR